MTSVLPEIAPDEGAEPRTDLVGGNYPDRSRRKRRSRRRRAFFWVGGVMIATLVAVGSMIAWVQWSEQGRIYAADDVPDRPVALVLGAGLQPDGAPSLYLTRRLDIARALYERGAARAILVSGDNSTTQYDEPTAMRGVLVRARGDRCRGRRSVIG